MRLQDDELYFARFARIPGCLFVYLLRVSWLLLLLTTKRSTVNIAVTAKVPDVIAIGSDASGGGMTRQAGNKFHRIH